VALRGREAAEQTWLRVVFRTWAAEVATAVLLKTGHSVAETCAATVADRLYMAAKVKGVSLIFRSWRLLSEKNSDAKAFKGRVTTMVSFVEWSMCAVDRMRAFHVWRNFRDDDSPSRRKKKSSETRVPWLMQKLCMREDVGTVMSTFLAWRDHVNEQCRADMLAAEAMHERLAIQEDVNMLQDQCTSSSTQLDELKNEVDALHEYLLKGILPSAQDNQIVQQSVTSLGAQCRLQGNQLDDLESELELLEAQLHAALPELKSQPTSPTKLPALKLERSMSGLQEPKQLPNLKLEKVTSGTNQTYGNFVAF